MSTRQRLYPALDEAKTLARHCADARYVWNLGLEQRGLYRPGRVQRVTANSQMRQLAEARRAFAWLAEGSSSIQQQALRDLDQAFQNWWKNPGHFGRPSWRRAGQHDGFRVVEVTTRRLNRKWAQVQIPKVGWVRFRLTRPWHDVDSGRSARVTLNRSGQWHVTFASPQPTLRRVPTNESVGLDLGVAISIATSRGELIRMPALLSPGETQRKRRLKRQRARQVVGSKRRGRTTHQIAKLCERESAKRKDWIEKKTTNLVCDYDLIAIEDLKVKNMVRSAKGTIETPGVNVRAKAGLNRAIHAQGWSSLRTRLEQKAGAATSPVDVVVVPARNTSRQCEKCGSTAKENRESQAVFHCRACGHHAHADVNAAKNILAAGLAVSGRGGTPQRGEVVKTSPSGPAKRQPLVGVAA